MARTAFKATRRALWAAAALSSAAAGAVLGQPPADPAAKEAQGLPDRSDRGMDASVRERTGALRNKLRELNTLFTAGRIAEAIPLAEAILAEAEALEGQEGPLAARSAYTLGVLYHMARRPQDAVEPLRRALAYEARRGAPDEAGYKSVVRQLAAVLTELQRPGEVTTIYRDAVERLRARGRPQSLDEAEYLAQLGHHLRMTGSFEEAERTLREAVAAGEAALAPDDPRLVSMLNMLAGAVRAAGKFGDAEALYKRAIAIMRKTAGSNNANLGILLDNLAVVYHHTGRIAEAEPLQKEAVEILERTLGHEHLNVGQALANLAELYREQDRLAEAEPLFERALAIFRKTLPPNDGRFGVVLDNLAGLYRRQGKYRLAKQAYQLALATLLAAYPSDHPEVAIAVNNLGLVHFELGELDQAEQFVRQSIAMTERALGRKHPGIASSYLVLGDILQAAERPAEARESFREAVSIIETALGSEHDKLVSPLTSLGLLDARARDFAPALAQLRRAIAIHVKTGRRGRLRGEADRGGRAGRQDLFAAFFDAAWEAAEAGLVAREEGAAETFMLAQWAAGSSAGVALAKLGARLGAGDDALGALVRERQDLGEEWTRLDRRLLAALSAPQERRLADAEQQMRQRLAKIDERLAEIDARLLTEFPAYAALADPKPLPAAETRALLGAGEALVQYMVTANNAYGWVVAKDTIRWARLAMAGGKIAEAVQALRCGFDPSEWIGETRPARCLSLVKAGPAEGLLPFDAGRAHELYKALLQPFEPDLDAKHLLIVASGPLTSLPFHVLQTEPAAAGSEAVLAPGRLRAAPWLLRRHALTSLPSVASLAVLRGGARPSVAAKPYLGIGNPLLLGRDGSDRSAFARQSCRAVSGPERRGAEIAAAGAPAGAINSYFRGGLADVLRLKLLEPLADTADELCTVARALGASEADVLLGSRASEKELGAANAAAVLARYRILHLATHGLVAGEVRGLAEPALVLSPPDTATEDDDGLLTASEVAALKLDADWVILSACNTAAGEGQGAEQMSGLARSFFYAGARSLLVSHWPVQSAAAVRLTTVTIEALRRNPESTRAQALRHAMLALMEDAADESNGHPQIWAPFVIVGEGGGANARAGHTGSAVAPAEASPPRTDYQQSIAPAGTGAVRPPAPATTPPKAAAGRPKRTKATAGAKPNPFEQGWDGRIFSSPR